MFVICRLEGLKNWKTLVESRASSRIGKSSIEALGQSQKELGQLPSGGGRSPGEVLELGSGLVRG